MPLNSAPLLRARQGAAASPSGATCEHLRVLLGNEDCCNLIFFPPPPLRTFPSARQVPVNAAQCLACAMCLLKLRPHSASAAWWPSERLRGIFGYGSLGTTRSASLRSPISPPQWFAWMGVGAYPGPSYNLVAVAHVCGSAVPLRSAPCRPPRRRTSPAAMTRRFRWPTMRHPCWTASPPGERICLWHFGGLGVRSAEATRLAARRLPLSPATTSQNRGGPIGPGPVAATATRRPLALHGRRPKRILEWAGGLLSM